MSRTSPKEQWKLVDDQFLDSQAGGVIDDLRKWATAYVERLSVERNLSSDTLAWTLHSLDTREFYLNVFSFVEMFSSHKTE